MSPAGPNSRGRFVVLDGVDGCGKSTQAGHLMRELERLRGQAPLHLREPGSTDLGEELRRLLLDRATHLSPAVETLLFCAARAHMLERQVAPALAQGRDVLCERFHPSTYAYQAIAGGLDGERVLALLNGWAGEPAPDLVLVLDLDPAQARARRGGDRDRIEAKGLDFQRRVAEGFRQYAASTPRTVLVSAAGDEREVSLRLLQAIRTHGGFDERA